MRKATRQSTGGELTANQVSAAFEEILNGERRISREETIGAIKSYFTSDEVQVASKILSLICPLSKSRIVNAAQGAACRHLECFDLRSYLQFHTTLTFWECPFEFCREKIPLEQLRISDYFTDVLQEVSDNVSSVELRPDGSYEVALPPAADVTINDEEPFETDLDGKPTIGKKQVAPCR
ncbi:SUMO ligase [Aphelenchoides avenae]|nr:SUMO ligase [Aphelenchus avenae]